MCGELGQHYISSHRPKATLLPHVSAIHKEYFRTGILIDILVMLKIPRPPLTPIQLHNVGDDNGNAANRTKEYTKLQVAGQTRIDVHQVLAETVTYFTDAS